MNIWDWDWIFTQLFRWTLLVSLVIGIILLIRVHFVVNRFMDWLMLYAPIAAPPAQKKHDEPPPPPPAMGCDFGVSGMFPGAFR